jgi:hypothetical protein
MLESFGPPEVYAYIVLPLLIFLARICDVSLGTIRVIFISKGVTYLAPIIGFFEVIIWLLAIGQVMNNLTNVVSYVAYGAGFAAGTYAGMVIEEKISIGLVIAGPLSVAIPTARQLSALAELRGDGNRRRGGVRSGQGDLHGCQAPGPVPGHRHHTEVQPCRVLYGRGGQVGSRGSLSPQPPGGIVLEDHCTAVHRK